MRNRFVGIVTAELAALPGGAFGRLMHRLNRRLGADVSLELRALAVEPLLLYHPVRYYWERPRGRGKALDIVARSCQPPAMGWRFTSDVEEYAAAAGSLLAADPAEHTISLTVIDNARGGTQRPDDPELFGWWSGFDGSVTGAVSHTPPHGLLLAAVPDEAVRPLVDGLIAMERRVPGVNGSAALAAQFAAVWTQATGERAVLEEAMRLFRLGRLVPPEPAPPGTARSATSADAALLTDWLRAFTRETGATPGANIPVTVADRLSFGGLWLWDDEDGTPISMAGRTRTVAGVARVAPVYTPPTRRGRGAAAGVTAAVTLDALERGAGGVVLFTQLENPTSNALYERLGYRPITDRTVLAFEPPANVAGASV